MDDVIWLKIGELSKGEEYAALLGILCFFSLCKRIDSYDKRKTRSVMFRPSPMAGYRSVTVIETVSDFIVNCVYSRGQKDIIVPPQMTTFSHKIFFAKTRPFPVR